MPEEPQKPMRGSENPFHASYGLFFEPVEGAFRPRAKHGDGSIADLACAPGAKRPRGPGHEPARWISQPPKMFAAFFRTFPRPAGVAFEPAKKCVQLGSFRAPHACTRPADPPQYEPRAARSTWRLKRPPSRHATPDVHTTLDCQRNPPSGRGEGITKTLTWVHTTGSSTEPQALRMPPA